MDTPQFAVMITGKWGCGKTYYIKERIRIWNGNKIRSGKDSIVLKPIYVSVNGLSSISSVVKKIKTALNPFMYSKGAKVAKKVALTALQVWTKSSVDIDGDGSGEDLGNLLDAEGFLEVFKSDSDAIKGNRILIIDDLERCKIHLDELFGFINDIVEHSNSKVILICDEEKLREVVEKEKLSVEYHDFKEKLVGQTFTLAVDYPAIVGTFINKKDNNLLSDNKGLIIDLFVGAKYENLRLVRHCLNDIVRFFKQLPENIEKNPNYKWFVSNVIAYLTISSLETRYGNNSVVLYQSYGINDTEKNALLELMNKYDSVLERHGIFFSTYSIPIEYLITFVNSGFIETPEHLVTNCRILQSDNMANWEKLLRYDCLSNDEFATLLKREKERFYHKQLGYVFEVVHLSGILISLEKKKLVKLSRNRLVGMAKSNIKAIYEKYPKELSRIALDPRGYKFQALDSAEMQEILQYVNVLFQKKIEAWKQEYVAGVWNSIGTEITLQELNKLFDVSTPTRRSKYSYEAIFTHVHPRVLVDRIVRLSNASKNEFSSFIVSRYFLKGASIAGTLTDGMKEDKQSLFQVSAMLKSRARRLSLIDKAMTLKVAKKIDEAVVKIEMEDKTGLHE